MKSKSAFTLIELLIVMSIIGLLSTFIIAMISAGSTAADAEKTRSALTIISRGLETYKSQANYYPMSQWTVNDPQPTWNPNDPYDNTDIWDSSNYKHDNPLAYAKPNRLIWRLSTRMSATDKSEMETAVEKAVGIVEAELVPGGSWANFTSKHPGYPIDSSRHYSNPTLGEAGCRAHNESVPKIDNLRKRFRKIGDKFMRNPDDSPVIVNELPKTDASWKFAWGRVGSSAFWCAWNYYSLEARSDAKRPFITLDVIDLASFDADLISEDGETLLDAWGNPIVYVERDYEPMPLMGGMHAVWQGVVYGRNGTTVGDMSRERGASLGDPRY